MGSAKRELNTAVLKGMQFTFMGRNSGLQQQPQPPLLSLLLQGRKAVGEAAVPPRGGCGPPGITGHMLW